MVPENASLKAAAIALLILLTGAAPIAAQEQASRAAPGPCSALSLILGRPTDRSVALSVLSAAAIEARVEYGTSPDGHARRTAVLRSDAGVPFEFEIGPLEPNTRYHYRLLARAPGAGEFRPQGGGTFQTRRAPGSTFAFAIQGDSHPERLGKMYDPALYAQTLRSVAKDPPDFHFAMGDDFSIERLIERGTLGRAAVEQVYAHLRGFLGIVGSGSALFLGEAHDRPLVRPGASPWQPAIRHI